MGTKEEGIGALATETGDIRALWSSAKHVAESLERLARQRKTEVRPRKSRLRVLTESQVYTFDDLPRVCRVSKPQGGHFFGFRYVYKGTIYKCFLPIAVSFSYEDARERKAINDTFVVRAEDWCIREFRDTLRLYKERARRGEVRLAKD